MKKKLVLFSTIILVLSSVIFYYYITNSNEYKIAENRKILTNNNLIKLELNTTSNNQNTFINATLEKFKPEPKSFKVTITVSKFDSNNVQVDSKSFTSDSFSIPLSFITEKDSNIDLTNGQLTFKLTLEGEKSNTYDVSGNTSVFLNGFEIVKNTFSRSGTSDQDGKLILRLDTPSGIGVIDFNKLTLNEGFNDLRIKINELKIKQNENEGKVNNIDIYSTILEKSTEKIITKNEKGEIAKLYPKDVTLQMTSTMGGEIRNFCSNVNQNSGCTIWHPYFCNVTPAKDVGTIRITDKSTGEIIVKTNPYISNKNISSGCIDIFNGARVDGIILVDVTIRRGTDYIISIDSPQNSSFEIHVPTTKTSYVFEANKGFPTGIIS